jgi:peptide deformylase
MSILDIKTPPDPVLRTEAEKVRAFTSDLRLLADDMVDTMRAAPGVGLAAPQVGISQRLIVVEFAEPPEEPDAEPADPQLFRVVNPEVVLQSRQTVIGTEGCLSLPGYLGDVERSRTVTVRGFSPDGQPITIRADGWLARIFQHEVDHLNGILFIDRASQVWKAEDEAQVETAAQV